MSTAPRFGGEAEPCRSPSDHQRPNLINSPVPDLFRESPRQRRNEAWKVSRNVLESFVGNQTHGFNLESLHEAFGFGVIVWIAAAARRTYESVLS
jgi:N-acyl-L-homoserine lactone synthetase